MFRTFAHVQLMHLISLTTVRGGLLMVFLMQSNHKGHMLTEGAIQDIIHHRILHCWHYVVVADFSLVYKTNLE